MNPTGSLIPSGFYQTYFKNTQDGLAYCQMLFDSQGQPVDFIYLKVNDNFTKLTGLKNVEGKKVSKVIPNVTITNPDVFVAYNQVVATGRTERYDVYIKQLDIWFANTVFAMDKDRFVMVFQNITQRKKVEQDLLDSKKAASNVLEDLYLEKSRAEIAQAKEEAIIMSIGDGLVVTDASGRLMLINQATTNMLGIQSDQVIGKSFYSELIIENEKGVPIPQEKRAMSLALHAGVTTVHTVADKALYLSRADKTKFPISYVTSPIMNKGKIIGAVQAFRDITHDKEIDRAKTEFVSLASHQLRTPTTAINWFSEMLLAEDIGVLTPKQREYLTDINKSNRRMIELVNALLNVSRIELGTFDAKPEPTDMIGVAEDILGELGNQIKHKELLLEKDYGAKEITIDIDPKMIRIILQNLLANAVEYTPAKGKVTIIIKQVTGYLHLGVSDNGCGIPKGDQSQIFTKFFRAENGSVLKSDGTGLGLYLTKLIVQALGGKISFKSTENKGTKFEVMVPIILNHK